MTAAKRSSGSQSCLSNADSSFRLPFSIAVGLPTGNSLEHHYLKTWPHVLYGRSIRRWPSIFLCDVITGLAMAATMRSWRLCSSASYQGRRRCTRTGTGIYVWSKRNKQRFLRREYQDQSGGREMTAYFQQ